MRIPLKQYRHLLADYLKLQQARVIGLAIALLSSIALQILSPQLLGYFIDTAVSGGATKTLATVALLFTGVAVLTQFFAIAATYFSENIAWTATNALRVDLVEHCLKLDLSFHKSRTPGEWVERIDGDITVLSRFFSQLVIHVLGNSILLIGILTILFLEDWRAGLGLSIFSFIALITLLGVQGYAIAPWASYRQLSAEFFGFVGEHVAGREDIRANGAVDYVMRRFYQILQNWLPIYHKARFASTLLWASSVGLFTTGNAIALALSAYLWNQNAITIGTAYLIFHYTNLLNQPIERIREELEELQQVEASIHRIRELFQVQSQLNQGGDRSLHTGALSVSFENVWFNYERSSVLHQSITVGKAQNTEYPQAINNNEQWVLQNISFHLPPGQVLGLLGRTGSGKTTIARLLLRLYNPQLGCVRLGDIATDQILLSDLRQRVGLVTQDVQLFQTTVRHNLTFFNPQIQDEQILQTLEWLRLEKWLRSLPQGLDTPLGSDSGGLSAGQAQLLAFARIFLKDPGLVILDEASSRLDPSTEHLIERAITQLLEHRTGIIIAHRLATVQRADQILILEHGKVLEYGDRQVLASNPNSRFSHLLSKGTTELLG